MKLPATLIVLLIALLAASSSQAADLVLRERATQQGAIIRLGDLADISASSSTEVAGLANTPLLPSPAAGTQQFLNVSQVRELLVARGIPVNQLNFRGASVIAIGASTERPKVEVAVKLTKKTRQEIELRVQKAIARYLQSTTSNIRWSVEVVLTIDQTQKIASFEQELVVRGARQPRSGRARFLVSTESQPHEITVTAQVAKIQPVVVVKQSIERGQLIRMADVEVREREGNLPNGSLDDLQRVIGKEAQRAMRPTEIVLQNHLRAPLQVRRGETVNVFVRTGGVVVRSRATAKENGALGDLITLETLEGKKRLDASVSGPGEVTLYATGGRTTDYASLNREANPTKLLRR